MDVLGKCRQEIWNNKGLQKKWEYLLQQCNDKERGDILFLTKAEKRIQKKIQIGLGYLSLKNLSRFVLQYDSTAIFENDNLKISECGSLHLINHYFINMLPNETELYSKRDKNIIFSDTSLSNTGNLSTISRDFGAEYLLLCQEMLPNMYHEKKNLMTDIEESKILCNTGSSLINHLLKLIIPFQRIIHLKRGYSYKIKGPCINVPSTVQKTVNKLLPQNMNDMLLSVALKRKLSYVSDYIFQEIQTNKVIEAFKRLKYIFKNPHYKDVVFSKKMLDNDIDTFVSSCKEKVKNIEQDKVDSEMDYDSSNSQSGDEELISVDENLSKLSEEDNKNKSKLQGDSLMIPLDRPSLTGSTLADAVATQIENQGVFVRKKGKKRESRKRQKFLQKLSIAPGEDNIPTDWLKDEYLEEKAFPHLFPGGEGGYVSTYKQKMKFSKYVKMRILEGENSSFRKNSTYVFFLLCVKERIQVRSMTSMFFRKAFKGRDLNANKLKNMNLADVQKSQAAYSVYKNLRGSPPYFQAQKKRCLAMIRQLGKPDLFVTFSAAEKHWPELGEQIFNTLSEEDKIRLYQSDTFAGLSDPMKNKMIQNNFVLMCDHFNRRIKKILSYLRSEANVLNSFRVKDFFYRVEFQQRGSPHVHMLLWLENKDGKSPEEVFTNPKDLAKWLDTIISSDTPTDNKDYVQKFIPNFEKNTGMSIVNLQEKASLFQEHHHTFTCRKKKGTKCKAIIVRKEEGYAIGQKDLGSEITQLSCRFGFPRYPIDETAILTPITDNEDKEHSKKLIRIKKYLIRQNFFDQALTNPECRIERFKNLSFKQMLQDLSLSREEYLNALRIDIRGKQKVFHERSPKNLFVNNYNAELLTLNSANMDFTFVSDEFACVAYILGYLTKDESQMSEALKNVDQNVERNKDIKKNLYLYANIFDRCRECSIQEAAWRLLGLDMVAGSRKLKVIVAREPKFRDGLLKPVMDKDYECDNAEIFVPRIFEHYAMRPYTLECVCLADFAAFFEFSTKSRKKQDNSQFFADDNEDNMENALNDKDYDDHFLNQIAAGTEFKMLDNSGYVKKRKFRCILNYRRDKKDATENARSTLLLFKSWRDENKDIHERDFKILLEEPEEEINLNQKKYEKNMSLFDQINEIEQKIKEDEENNLAGEVDGEEYQDEIEIEVDNFERELTSKQTTSSSKDETTDKMEHEAMRQQVNTLNGEQRAILDDYIERVSLPVGVLPPTLLHILGSAGTGKSYLLRTLIAVTRYILEKSYTSINSEQPTVQIGAPTNNSAFQILGQTLHSLFGFGFGGEDDSNNTYTNVNGEIAKDLPWKFFNTRLLFLDEVSMVGSNMFSKISLRLQEIVNLFPGWKSKSFGGLDMVVLGDFFQLPPVLDRFCFKNSTLRGRCSGLSINHYTKNVRSYFITEKVRSCKDKVFGELCDRISKNSLQRNDYKLLEDRCNLVCPGEDNNESFKNGDIMILCLENKTIDEINARMLEKVNKNSKLYEFVAQDKFANFSDPVGTIDLSYTETQNLPTKLALKIDTPVIITKNINKKDKLVNGKRGYVHDIDTDNKIIWVHFYEKDVGNIARIQSKFKPKKTSSTAVPIYMWKSPVTFAQFGKRKGGASVSRCNQFPIVPAYASTVHKSQGQTLKYVIIDFKQNSNRAVANGAFYTAISRATSLQNVFLKDFKKSYIRTDPDVLQEIERLKTVPYQFIKPYLIDPVFKNCSKELKISYLNSNGLIHILQDIKADINLMQSDILCVSEIKMSKTVSNEDFKIANFDICCRLDGETNGSGGMVVYIKNSLRTSVEIVEKRRKIYRETYLEQIRLQYEGENITFVYFHPNLAKKASDALKLITQDFADSTGKIDRST